MSTLDWYGRTLEMMKSDWVRECRHVHLYKHMEKCHVASFYSGRLRFGSLSDFRDVEKHHTQIGDEGEGKVSIGVRDYVAGTPQTGHQRLIESAVPYGNGARYSSCTFNLNLSGYVFCVSQNCHQSPVKAYDAIVRIIDPIGLFWEIAHFGKWSIQSVDDSQKETEVRPESIFPLQQCAYRGRAFEMDSSDIPPHLLKESNLDQIAWREWRMLVDPPGLARGKALFCDIRNIDSYVLDRPRYF